MNVKSLDEKIDVGLWIALVACALLSWWFVASITAPKYEPADSDEKISYTINGDDGDKVEAQYQLAWDHTGYSPRLIARDFEHDRNVSIKDEYLGEYLATTPPSAYPHLYNHIFWWLLIGLIILWTLVIFFFGQYLRDQVLYSRIIKSPNFTDVSYFLFHDRFAHKDDVKALIPSTAPSYIASKRAELEKTHSPALVKLAMSMLNEIAKRGSTEVDYHLSFKNSLQNQNEFLESLQNYWRTRLGVDQHAPRFIDELEVEKKYVYEPFPNDLGEKSEYQFSVTSELNRIFKEVMGSEVFKFTPFVFQEPGRIHITIELINTSKYYTWPGKSVKFPGIKVNFTISVWNLMGKDDILWQGTLQPECNYSATEDDFSATKLYKNMVHTTINTLSSKI